MDDDLAKAVNPDSRNQVVDAVVSNLNSGSLALGFQYLAGTGPLRFMAGFNVSYSIAGGSLGFNYGNTMTPENRVPSTMPMARPAVEKILLSMISRRISESHMHVLSSVTMSAISTVLVSVPIWVWSGS